SRSPLSGAALRESRKKGGSGTQVEHEQQQRGPRKEKRDHREVLHPIVAPAPCRCYCCCCQKRWCGNCGLLWQKNCDVHWLNLRWLTFCRSYLLILALGCFQLLQMFFRPNDMRIPLRTEYLHPTVESFPRPPPNLLHGFPPSPTEENYGQDVEQLSTSWATAWYPKTTKQDFDRQQRQFLQFLRSNETAQTLWEEYKPILVQDKMRPFTDYASTSTSGSADVEYAPVPGLNLILEDFYKRVASKWTDDTGLYDLSAGAPASSTSTKNPYATIFHFTDQKTFEQDILTGPLAPPVSEKTPNARLVDVAQYNFAVNDAAKVVFFLSQVLVPHLASTNSEKPWASRETFAFANDFNDRTYFFDNIYFDVVEQELQQQQTNSTSAADDPLGTEKYTAGQVFTMLANSLQGGWKYLELKEQEAKAHYETLGVIRTASGEVDVESSSTATASSAFLSVGKTKKTSSRKVLKQESGQELLQQHQDANGSTQERPQQLAAPDSDAATLGSAAAFRQLQERQAELKRLYAIGAQHLVEFTLYSLLHPVATIEGHQALGKSVDAVLGREFENYLHYFDLLKVLEKFSPTVAQKWRAGQISVPEILEFAILPFASSSAATRFSEAELAAVKGLGLKFTTNEVLVQHGVTEKQLHYILLQNLFKMDNLSVLLQLSPAALEEITTKVQPLVIEQLDSILTGADAATFAALKEKAGTMMQVGKDELLQFLVRSTAAQEVEHQTASTTSPSSSSDAAAANNGTASPASSFLTTAGDVEKNPDIISEQRAGRVAGAGRERAQGDHIQHGELLPPRVVQSGGSQIIRGKINDLPLVQELVQDEEVQASRHSSDVSATEDDAVNQDPDDELVFLEGVSFLLGQSTEDLDVVSTSTSPVISRSSPPSTTSPKATALLQLQSKVSSQEKAAKRATKLLHQKTYSKITARTGEQQHQSEQQTLDVASHSTTRRGRETSTSYRHYEQHLVNKEGTTTREGTTAASSRRASNSNSTETAGLLQPFVAQMDRVVLARLGWMTSFYVEEAENGAIPDNGLMTRPLTELHQNPFAAEEVLATPGAGKPYTMNEDPAKGYALPLEERDTKLHWETDGAPKAAFLFLVLVLSALFGFWVSGLIPLSFVYNIFGNAAFLERETKMMDMQLIYGLPKRTYWLANISFFYVLFFWLYALLWYFDASVYAGLTPQNELYGPFHARAEALWILLAPFAVTLSIMLYASAFTVLCEKREQFEGMLGFFTGLVNLLLVAVYIVCEMFLPTRLSFWAQGIEAMFSNRGTPQWHGDPAFSGPAERAALRADHVNCPNYDLATVNLAVSGVVGVLVPGFSAMKILMRR
ncbi:unnamed protein product, partial [Amoebophrya sp. A120]